MTLKIPKTLSALAVRRISVYCAIQVYILENLAVILMMTFSLSKDALGAPV
jgi:hypothetical protein